ncbi:MAG TPA: hypothetical protein VGQ81_08780 [Acidobacteriota bacterium]|jgi:hypothetical protein|nr:hypothetical protein [Acidobacteriota bacterium]
MKLLKTLVIVVLIAVLPLVNTGCLTDLGGSLDDAAYAWFLGIKGLVFCFLLDFPIDWPSASRITFGGNLRGRSNFTAGWGYGEADLYYPSAIVEKSKLFGKSIFSPDDLFRNAVVPSFTFPIVAGNSNTLCVDFSANYRCDPGEPTLQYNSSANQVTLNNPALGSGLKAGAYIFTLNPSTYEIQSGFDNFAGDIQVQITGGGRTIQRNFLLLREAQVLPDVAFGDLGVLGTLTTQIVVNNPNGNAVQGGLQFFKQDGNPMNVQIGSVTASKQTFSVPAKSSLLLEINPFGVSAPQVGWGFGYGNAHLEYSIVFGTYANAAPGKISDNDPRFITGNLRREVGIPAAARLSMEHVMVVNKTAGGGDTAFAIANPTGATANLLLTLKDPNGQRAQKSLTLGPKNQTARFFNEFFGTSFSIFAGTLVIKSDTDVAVLSLKTFNGEQSSSLPSGIRQ